jgi:hypothetical protein
MKARHLKTRKKIRNQVGVEPEKVLEESPGFSVKQEKNSII